MKTINNSMRRLSKNESRFYDILLKYTREDVNISLQHSFSDLKNFNNKCSLYFDFALFYKNCANPFLLIELDGPEHNIINSFNRKTKNNYKKELYARRKGIPLLRINNSDNFDTILNDVLTF